MTITTLNWFKLSCHHLITIALSNIKVIIIIILRFFRKSKSGGFVFTKNLINKQKVGILYFAISLSRKGVFISVIVIQFKLPFWLLFCAGFIMFFLLFFSLFFNFCLVCFMQFVNVINTSYQKLQINLYTGFQIHLPVAYQRRLCHLRNCLSEKLHIMGLFCFFGNKISISLNINKRK